MISTDSSIANASRLYFLDNLRSIIIFLVVLYHVGLVYESTGVGASFWIVDDPATNNLSGILNLIIDIFVMPTLFFVSGYLTPRSLKSKGGMAFLESRFKRLMIPWLIAVLTLIPLYKFIFLHSRNLPQESWTTYFHFSNGNISSQNWLWFLPVLFLFNLLFVLLPRVDWVPTSISLRFAVAAIFLIGVVNSFSMDLLKVRGWTLTPLIDFQNERLLVYFMMFLLGALCFRQQVFAARPKSRSDLLA
jgi:fucose 4-O-acetylase-like acetyltransferase